MTAAGFVSTSVGVIRPTTSTKTDSGVTTVAMPWFIIKDTNSCFGIGAAATLGVEPFLITAGLQGSLGTNEPLPRATTQ